MTPLSNNIGKRIRVLRKEKGLTLAQLAKLCGCSPSLLSQIETNVINPSLNTIHTIADAFGVPLVNVVSEVKDTEIPSDYKLIWSISDPDNRKVMTLKNGNVHFELLSRGISVPYEFVLCIYPPGACSGESLAAHPGEESGYLLEGELDVQIEEEIIHMTSGQTITILSTVPHRLINRGDKQAVAIWVNSTPFLFSVN